MKRVAPGKRPHARTIVQKRGPSAAVKPGDAFLVRPAELRDIAAVVALDAQITSIAKEDHWKDLFERSRSHGAAQFFLVATAAEPPSHLLGFIVGEIRAWEFGSAPCGWVYVLSVDPGVRERGVGEALLQAIAGNFKRHAMTTMRTMVAKDNPLPMRFFRAEGMMAGPYIQLEKELE